MPNDSSKSSRNTTRAGFSLVVVFAALVAFSVYWVSDQQLQAERWVNHTQDVLHLTGHLRSTISDLRVSGFIITGREDYLEPYRKAQTTIGGQLDALEKLLEDNPEQKARIEVLRAEIPPRVAALDQVIAARRSGGFAAAQNLVIVDQPWQMKAKIRPTLDTIEQQEENLLKERTSEQKSSIRAFWTAMGSLVGLLIAALGLLYVLDQRRQTTSERLRESEDRFRMLADNAVEFAVVLLDPAGHVTTWNRGAERLTGYAEGDFLGSHFSRFYSEEEVRSGKPQQVLEIAARQGRSEDEGWRVRKDGSRFWANVIVTTLRDADGHLKGYGQLMRDLTERKQTEDELRERMQETKAIDAQLELLNATLEQRVEERTNELNESNLEKIRHIADRVQAELLLERSESRLRGILDSAMDAIITIDDQQNVVMYNDAAEGLFGYTRKQVLGTSIDKLVPQRFRGMHGGHVKRFGETHALPRRMGGLRVVTGLRADGTEFPIDASISQLVEGGNRFYTVILRDVTRQVRAEAELRQSRDELRELGAAGHSAREQEKTRIARELHDELGQALTALKMDVAWLKEVVHGNAQVAERLGAMHTLIDSTVAATRRISADLRPMVLDDLGLAAAIEWLVKNFTQRTGIPCELAIGTGELGIKDLHATAVFRIVQESLTNVARHAGATQVEIAVDRDDQAVTITVRDNGRGFDTADMRKPKSFGLLGLRERAYLMRGKINIESKPGAGALIEISIPVVAQLEHA